MFQNQGKAINSHSSEVVFLSPPSTDSPHCCIRGLQGSNRSVQLQFAVFLEKEVKVH